MQRKAQRVGVFVDVQNMYYSGRALYDQRVDFGEILKEAVGERQLVRALAYVIRADKEEEESFFNALEDRGYELRAKDLLRFYGGNEKGDWDIGMAMDIVKMCDKLDAIVLVSGDGDFADLLEYVKSRGCSAEVMAFGSSASSQLREAADALLDLSANPNRFLIPKKRGDSRPKGKRADSGRPILDQEQKDQPASNSKGSNSKQKQAQPKKSGTSTKKSTKKSPTKRSSSRRSSSKKKS